MRILKVGGGVLTGPDPVRALASLIREEADRCVLVVSAFGKTTNRLEQVARECVDGRRGDALRSLEGVVRWHDDLAEALGVAWEAQEIPACVEAAGRAIASAAADPPRCLADSLVSLGEQLSSRIVAAFLAAEGLPARWVDATRVIVTDETFGAARVHGAAARPAIRAEVGGLTPRAIPVVAGFIGATVGGRPTTLGREGSDYTAAILGAALGAEEVVLLKNVPGVLTADPAVVADARLISRLSFGQAARMFVAGAKVVHPKTIQPLRRAGIALRVAPFGDSRGGTVIGPGYSWGQGGLHAIAGRYNGEPGSIPDFLPCQVTVLGEPPIHPRVSDKVEEIAQAVGLKVRRRLHAHGTWILEARSEQCEDAMRQLHALVDHGREES